MKATQALYILTEITAYQWGMLTTAQAHSRGVSRLDLSRLAAAGLLERLAHGIYRSAGAPAGPLDDMYAAWLSTEPDRLAHERLAGPVSSVVFGGASAARLHRIGDVWDRHHDFITPGRRQSQRADIRYRKRTLDPRDVTAIGGLPTLTEEATIADLFSAEADLGHVADALRDATARRRLDLARLEDLLAPHAARNGLRTGDGRGLRQHLMHLAGLDVDSLARSLARSPSYSTLSEIARMVEHVG